MTYVNIHDNMEVPPNFQDYFTNKTTNEKQWIFGAALEKSKNWLDFE